MSFYRYPVDSADARELREFEAENPEQPFFHDPRCEDGWLGEDERGRPIPCLQCRPHLARR